MSHLQNGIFVLMLLIACVSASAKDSLSAEASKSGERDKKVFSLFSVVTFKNQQCTSQSSSRNGTCYTATECSTKGGSASGNCAAGFGVCCLFIVTASSTTISENGTYIQNPSFPSVYSATTALTYTVNKCATDVCALRLDFDTFTILGPTLTTEADSNRECRDKLILTATSTGTTPTFCGEAAGQHLYVEFGAGSTGTVEVAFTFNTATSTVRTWELRTTQIPCHSEVRPPSGCLQYHTTLSGRFQTFNFDGAIHLIDQDYDICIRQAAGYCCIQYSLCQGETKSFSLDRSAATVVLDEDCITLDHVEIDGVSLKCSTDPGTVKHSKICGQIFNLQEAAALVANTVCDCTTPFVVTINTEDTAEANVAAGPNNGLCLDYVQMPCN